MELDLAPSLALKRIQLWVRLKFYVQDYNTRHYRVDLNVHVVCV